MGVFDWFTGSRPTLRDGSFWSAFFGAENWAGKQVGPDSAMQISTAWSCVRLIAETVGTLPFGIYKRDGDKPRPAPEHELNAIIHDTPNSDQTAVEFIEGLAMRLCLYGNSYCEKKLAGGRVVALTHLPIGTKPVMKDGKRFYRVPNKPQSEDLPEERVFSVRGFGDGGPEGLSPIAFARQTLGISIAADETTAKQFGNGLRPSGFLSVDQTLKPEQRMQLQRVMGEFVGSTNAGKLMILEAGMKYSQLTMPPQDAELLTSRRFNVEEICRWFAVPPILVGHAGQGQTMWGTGIEQIMLGWLTTGLRPYLKRIETAVNKRLLSVTDRPNYYSKFNIEGLLRADSIGRAEFYSKMAVNGVYTRNEIRGMEDLPPLDGGDVLTVQAQLIPIADIGKLASGRVPQPLPPGLGVGTTGENRPNNLGAE